MKLVILAGGLGSRLAEDTDTKPKPMIEIGGKPIIWHIMKIYSFYGVKEFIICCGYKGYVIKEYFRNYFFRHSNITIDMSNNNILVHQVNAESWKVTLVDTGENTMTGGRLKRISRYLKNDPVFFFTYGDGLSDVNISKLLKFHKKNNVEASLTAVQPSGRYGALNFKDETMIESFLEKPKGDGSWINGGFFVLNSSVLKLIKDDNTIWEEGPLSTLAKKNQLQAYKHTGFWHSMDTLRDKNLLNDLWNKGKAPWKLW